MCLLGGPKPVNLGRVRDSPQWVDGVAVLTYVDGDLCPDQIRKKSTTIRLTCSENQVVSDVASSALALPLWGQRGASQGAQGTAVLVGGWEGGWEGGSPVLEDRPPAPRRLARLPWLWDPLVLWRGTRVCKSCRGTGLCLHGGCLGKAGPRMGLAHGQPPSHRCGLLADFATVTVHCQ